MHPGNDRINKLDRRTEAISSPAAPLPSQSLTCPPLRSACSSTPGERKRRTRKIPTKEIAPGDSHALIALGMSPFMPGLDAISNQNRLVRNESILTRHVSRLEASFSTSESKHAQRYQDIYRILTEHASALSDSGGKSDNTSSTCSCTSSSPFSILSDPDFMVLVEGHIEMRNALNALITKASAFKRAVAQLNSELSELKAEFIAIQKSEVVKEVALTSSSQISSESIRSSQLSRSETHTRLSSPSSTLYSNLNGIGRL